MTQSVHQQHRHVDGLTIWVVRLKLLHDGCLHSFWLHLLRKFNLIVATTCKVNRLAQATETETYKYNHKEDAECDERLLVVTHEVESSVLHHVLRELRRELQVLPLTTVEEVLVSNTSQPHSSEEGADDTDNQSGCETLDRTSTEIIKNDTREDSRHV